jgi:hypothetical protein
MFNLYSYKCVAIFQQVRHIDAPVAADDIERAIVLSFWFDMNRSDVGITSGLQFLSGCLKFQK